MIKFISTKTSGGSSVPTIHIHRDAKKVTIPEISVQQVGAFGFDKQEDGSYKNTNQLQDNTESSCVLTFTLDEPTTMVFECTQDSEYADYGSIGDIQLMGQRGSFNIEYECDVGENHIPIQYQKDRAMSYGTDTFTFKPTFPNLKDIEEIDMDVYVTQYDSIDSMMSAEDVPLNTYAITYIKDLSANVYRKTEDGWKFVGVKENDNFVHYNIRRGTKIGELTGSLPSTDYYNGLRYDKYTGELWTELYINAEYPDYLDIAIAKLCQRMDGTMYVSIDYRSTQDVDFENQILKTKFVLPNTNDEPSNYIVEIGAYDYMGGDTMFTHYVDIDYKFEDIPYRFTHGDIWLSAVNTDALTARYSPLLKAIQVKGTLTCTFNQPENVGYDASGYIGFWMGDKEINYFSFYGNYQNTISQSVDFIYPIDIVPEEIAINIDLRDYSYTDQSLTFGNMSIQSNDYSVILSTSVKNYIDTRFSITRSILTLNCISTNYDTATYLCKVLIHITYDDLGEDTENLYYYLRFGETVDIELNKLPKNITYELDNELIDMNETVTLLSNSEYQLKNKFNQNTIVLQNCTITSSYYTGTTITFDKIDSKGDGFIKGYCGSYQIPSYTRIVSYGENQLIFSGASAYIHTLDELKLIHQRYGNANDLDTNNKSDTVVINEDGSYTNTLEEYDMTDTLGYKISGTIKSETVDNSGLYDVAITITNETLFRNTVLPEITKDITFKEFDIFNRMFCTFVMYDKDDKPIFTSDNISLGGGSGGSYPENTFFVSDGGPSTEDVGEIVIATKRIEFKPIINNDVLLLGDSKLLGKYNGGVVMPLDVTWKAGLYHGVGFFYGSIYNLLDNGDIEVITKNAFYTIYSKMINGYYNKLYGVVDRLTYEIPNGYIPVKRINDYQNGWTAAYDKSSNTDCVFVNCQNPEQAKYWNGEKWIDLTKYAIVQEESEYETPLKFKHASETEYQTYMYRSQVINLMLYTDEEGNFYDWGRLYQEE